MKTKLLVKYLGIGIVSFSLTCTNINAQDRDFGGLNRYAQENEDISISHKTVKVVFMGNSITEGWVNTHPDFFTDNGYVGRGISGQTSYQFLLRFREDVIK